MPVTNFSIAELMGDVADSNEEIENINVARPPSHMELKDHGGFQRLSNDRKGSPHSVKTNLSSSNKINIYDQPQDTELQKSSSTAFQRKRTSFSRLQQRMLEAKFQRAPYLTIQERNNLANFLELNSRQVKVWFQNRRNKWKRENRGQLLIQPSLEMKSYASTFENCFSCVMYNPYAHFYLKSDK